MRTTSISNVKQGSAGGKGALYEETCTLVLYYLCSQVPTRIYTCNKASFFLHSIFATFFAFEPWLRAHIRRALAV